MCSIMVLIVDVQEMAISRLKSSQRPPNQFNTLTFQNRICCRQYISGNHVANGNVR